MKYIFTYILFIVACIFISCGQSEKEKAAIQQKHDDSIKTATENEVLWKILILLKQLKNGMMIQL